MSSLTAMYGLMSVPYLTPVLNFTAFRFGHLATTCSTAVFYRCTVESILIGSLAAHRILTFSAHTDNIAFWVIFWSLSLWSVQCSLWSLSLWSANASYGHCHSALFRASFGHCNSAVFSAPYGHCHPAVFNATYGLSHSAPYRHAAVVMNVPSPRTASRQNDAAASHSCHFNTVLYPRSYSQCQLPLNHSRRDITGAASSLHNYHKIFAVTALSSLHFCRPVNIYIMLYNVPL